MKTYEELPFEIIDIEEDERKEKYSSPYTEAGVLVGPNKYWMPESYRKCGLEIYNFQAREDDVYVIGYPRTGTTLTCEMVWLIGNDLNYEGAKKNLLAFRFPHVDFSIFADGLHVLEMPQIGEGNVFLEKLASQYQNLGLQSLEQIKGRRFLKSHLPLSLNPSSMFEVGAKVIYCARNPKDVIVSMYNAVLFFTNRTDMVTSFEEFFRMFKDNWGIYLPFFEHVKEAWARRHDENFLFLFYEDTVKDKRGTITKTAEFLGKSLSKDEIDALEEHLNVKNFKKNSQVNNSYLVQFGLASRNIPFIGKGKSGGWKDYFHSDLEKEVDAWIEEQLKDTDLRFPEV